MATTGKMVADQPGSPLFIPDGEACDRFACVGATAFSDCGYYAGGTKYQRESSFDDTADDMFKYRDGQERSVGTNTL